MGGFSPVLYWLLVPARHALNCQNLGACQNLGVRLKFTDFKQTIEVFISAHRRPIKELKKHKCSLSLSNIKLEANLEIHRCGLKLFKRGMGDGGGLYFAPSSTCLAIGYSRLPQVSFSPSPPFSVSQQAGRVLIKIFALSVQNREYLLNIEGSLGKYWRMQLHTGAEHFGNVIFRYSELPSQYHIDASIDVNRRRRDCGVTCLLWQIEHPPG
jgi:hypothetical protein